MYLPLYNFYQAVDLKKNLPPIKSLQVVVTPYLGVDVGVVYFVRRKYIRGGGYPGQHNAFSSKFWQQIFCLKLFHVRQHAGPS